MRWIGFVFVCLVCISLGQTACHTTATNGASAKPAPKPHTSQTIAQRISLARWQMAVTAEVAYRDQDPEKRRAFIDLHAERVAVYLVLREHEHDEDPAGIDATRAAIRELRALRSPEANTYCATTSDSVCSLPK